MRKLQRGSGVLIFWGVIVLALGGGWVANIVKLVGMEPILTGMGIARIAGIFVAPLGGVLGWV